MGELKNWKWELNAHLFSSLDLNESEPLNLRVAQKSFRETKGGKEKGDYIHSSWADWRKEAESWRKVLKEKFVAGI